MNSERLKGRPLQVSIVYFSHLHTRVVLVVCQLLHVLQRPTARPARDLALLPGCTAIGMVLAVSRADDSIQADDRRHRVLFKSRVFQIKRRTIPP